MTLARLLVRVWSDEETGCVSVSRIPPLAFNVCVLFNCRESQQEKESEADKARTGRRASLPRTLAAVSLQLGVSLGRVLGSRAWSWVWDP